ncbi:DoxX-like family protein [Brevibacillus daliensis]|uniref:DoxX-like family protein n=1 Tax=Brevibacillus daliensis TaxID=2892995 RepID=UPI001E3F6E13|nr:DoxX-like family protein [Brevibacillus daliensis]
MTKNKPIYVESTIRTDIETLWKYTQTPELHEQWDLRFTKISYLPKKTEAEPQRFLYQTNIGFGLSISGEGKSVGTTERDETKTSVLKFWSDNAISLIREGSGFWRYVPSEDGIRFFTRYDYQTRFGTMGRWLDRMLFRPMMGWATAWSFDALRLWIEKGIHPKLSFLRALTELICWSILAFIRMYQGLFPKLLYPQTRELQLLQATQLFQGYEQLVLFFVGAGEIGFGLLFFLVGRGRRKALYLGNLFLLVFLGLGALSQPNVFVEPFNPVTLNICMMALSVIGILNLTNLPNAYACLRKPTTDKLGTQVNSNFN